MIRTRRELTLTFGPGRIQHTVTVPKGHRLSRRRDGHGGDTYFVEEFENLLRGSSFAIHDANYYGIRVRPEDVETDDDIT